ncbi:hypothetical protein MY11210_007549 [Beauveria gryllotalpidicola]
MTGQLDTIRRVGDTINRIFNEEARFRRNRDHTPWEIRAFQAEIAATGADIGGGRYPVRRSVAFRGPEVALDRPWRNGMFIEESEPRRPLVPYMERNNYYWRYYYRNRNDRQRQTVQTSNRQPVHGNDHQSVQSSQQQRPVRYDQRQQQRPVHYDQRQQQRPVHYDQRQQQRPVHYDQRQQQRPVHYDQRQRQRPVHYDQRQQQHHHSHHRQSVYNRQNRQEVLDHEERVHRKEQQKQKQEEQQEQSRVRTPPPRLTAAQLQEQQTREEARRTALAMITWDDDLPEESALACPESAFERTPTASADSSQEQQQPRGLIPDELTPQWVYVPSEEGGGVEQASLDEDQEYVNSEGRPIRKCTKEQREAGRAGRMERRACLARMYRQQQRDNRSTLVFAKP